MKFTSLVLQSCWIFMLTSWAIVATLVFLPLLFWCASLGLALWRRSFGWHCAVSTRAMDSWIQHASMLATRREPSESALQTDENWWIKIKTIKVIDEWSLILNRNWCEDWVTHTHTVTLLGSPLWLVQSCHFAEMFRMIQCKPHPQSPHSWAECAWAQHSSVDNMSEAAMAHSWPQNSDAFDLFPQQQNFAMGSLAQISSGAIRCSFNTRFRTRFRRVLEQRVLYSSGGFRCRYLVKFRRVPVQIPCEVPEVSGAATWWGSGGSRWRCVVRFRRVPGQIPCDFRKVPVQRPCEVPEGLAEKMLGEVPE